MNSLRKFHLSLLVYFPLLLAVLGTASCDRLPGRGQAEPVEAMPLNAAFIVRMGNVQRVADRMQERPYGESLKNKLLPGSLAANHAALEAFLRHTGLVDSSANVPMLASVHLASAGSLNSIHYYPVRLPGKRFDKLLREHFPGAASQSWNYEGVQFHEILLPGLETKLNLAHANGLLIASSVAFLAEDAVKQLRSGNSLLDEPGFGDVYRKETAGADVNVWLPFGQMKHWMTLFAAYGQDDRIARASAFASWMLADVYLNEDGLFFSGLTSARPGNALPLLASQSTCAPWQAEYLPFNTAAFTGFSGLPDSTAGELRAAGLGACWSRVLLEPLNENIGEHWVALLPVQDKELYDQKKANREAFGALLGKLPGMDGPLYFERTGDYLAASASRQSLDNYLNNVRSSQVLSQDERFQSLSGEWRVNAQVTLYYRMRYLKEAVASLYESDERAQEDFGWLRNFDQVSLQFARQGGAYETTGHATFSENAGGGHTSLAWSAPLAGPVLTGPVAVELDRAGNTGILVQDTEFNLYLLDKSGREIWKMALESRWLGTAYSLRLYDDDAVQLTFNTENQWHLVNAAGEPLSGFPLKFKDRASSGMALYTGNKNTYVFIASRNNNLYGYEISGKPLSGWNPQSGTGLITETPQVTVEKGNLMVSAVNEEGTAWIWSLDGKRRAKNMFRTRFPSQHYADAFSSPFKIKNVQPDGELISLNPDGRVGRYQLPVERVEQFAMANIAGSDEPEIIVSDGKTIHAFSYTGSPLWKRGQAGSFQVIRPGGAYALLAVSEKAGGSVVLLDGRGQTATSLPEGLTQPFAFAPGLLGEGQMAVAAFGGEDNLVCYRIALPVK